MSAAVTSFVGEDWELVDAASLAHVVRLFHLYSFNAMGLMLVSLGSMLRPSRTILSLMSGAEQASEG